MTCCAVCSPFHVTVSDAVAYTYIIYIIYLKTTNI